MKVNQIFAASISETGDCVKFSLVSEGRYLTRTKAAELLGCSTGSIREAWSKIPSSYTDEEGDVDTAILYGPENAERFVEKMQTVLDLIVATRDERRVKCAEFVANFNALSE